MAVTEPIQDSAEQAGAVEDQHFQSVLAATVRMHLETHRVRAELEAVMAAMVQQVPILAATDWYLVVVEVAEAEPEPAVMVPTVE